MTRKEKKEELIRLFCIGAITIGDLIDECFEFGQQHPRWISVEDELPEKGDIVIVMQDAYGNIHFTACEFISAMQLCDVTDFHVRSDAYLGITKKAEITLGAVTHWMPLPQPPEHIAGISNKTACPDCFVAQYPPCGKGIPCCKCHEEGCNSRQPCPKKGGEQ